ncbi:23S rRNA (adenine(1618)-N(6))-methyltransferase RlmF [Psychromonas sp. MME2]|uniref:23S rRNA (adenine(1618)-N(6))-methyltransferase RlmF n=1 Tax=unclassified Psychromonas TaxID=2614957 RepID=UPI00339BF725
MKNKQQIEKGRLHPRNLHSQGYDFKKLCTISPALTEFVIRNPDGRDTIDFANSNAVLALNQALLKCFYHVDFWQIPTGYLSPPIPGRADYIHYLADLLAECNNGIVPTGKQIKVLDIGSGANCIYPILGSQLYGWSFRGSDIDSLAVKTANLIVTSNPQLSPFVKLVLQKNKNAIFDGIIKKQDRFALTMCNPPFHASKAEAMASNARKVNNLSKDKKTVDVSLNFAGQDNELYCDGGEIAFLKEMVRESKNYAEQVVWFTSLVSKSENIAVLKKYLLKMGAIQVRVINMSQGQKISRLIAWSFLSEVNLQLN